MLCQSKYYNHSKHSSYLLEADESLYQHSYLPQPLTSFPPWHSRNQDNSSSHFYFSYDSKIIILHQLILYVLQGTMNEIYVCVPLRKMQMNRWNLDLKFESKHLSFLLYATNEASFCPKMDCSLWKLVWMWQVWEEEIWGKGVIEVFILFSFLVQVFFSVKKSSMHSFYLSLSFS